tara:strand:+ start:13864 stop:14349 length:486 start_codon:yes stop_codon:yes gene_type:complete
MKGLDEYLNEGSKLDKTFFEWFKDSKVLDHDNKPLKVFHGSNKQFNTFSYDHFGKTDCGNYGKGFYFSPDRQVAKAYAEQSVETQGIGKPVVSSYYLSFQNPLVRDSDWFEGQIKNILDCKEIEKFTDMVKRKGFDSIIVGKNLHTAEYVAFEPKQIMLIK